MNQKETLPERLKDLRKRNNLTQKQIAEKLCISQQAYASYETGKKEPKIDTLRMLADIFKTSIDYLVGRY